MSDDEIAFAITLSITLSVLFIFAVDGKDILTTLRPGAANRWALRLQPFGMTPDLGGYAFGGFIIALLFSNFSNVPVLRQAGWAAKTVLAGMSAMITLATMARGGFVAVVATLMIYVARNVAFHKRLRLYIIFGVGALVIGGGIYWSTIAAYMTEMLELDSSHRGIGSGGTGRLELWQRGIEFIFGRSWEVLIGSGLRSSDISYIGFFTESSYITLAIEMGVFASAFLVGCFLFLLYRTGKDEFRRNDAFGKMAFYCITYAMLQSIFNRYLIAIGNPFSLMFLIIVSRAFLNQANERRALARRRHTAFRTRATMQQEPAATSQRTALGR
jgi:hypothetical protein